MNLVILKVSENKGYFLLITLVPFPHFRASYPKVLFLSLAIGKLKIPETLNKDL